MVELLRLPDFVLFAAGVLMILLGFAFVALFGASDDESPEGLPQVFFAGEPKLPPRRVRKESPRYAVE